MVWVPQTSISAHGRVTVASISSGLSNRGRYSDTIDSILYESADSYGRILTGTVIPGIEAKGIEGFRGIEVLRRDHESEVEFVTIMAFDSLQSVVNFQGEDYERAYVPDVARAVLKRWDSTAAVPD
ncbi:MAG: hypothetical protein P8Y73_06550 [Desulfuromonadales bacterium]